MTTDKQPKSEDRIPQVEIHDVRTPFIRKQALGRREFFQKVFTVAALSGIAAAGIRWHAGRKPPTDKIVVTPRCVGCTGCAVICPTMAIEVIPEGIAVKQEDCISCGYCQAGCAVDGIRVLQEDFRHA